ncbi:acyl-CoA dehydrogenase family protein [Amycolatopsis benzoatilytica]|uniref:acyl-CoA dehydrogenase family protein n=1 Tax=Amycolatopsis benzoatilytica TaxID=346045 RepID=UPI000371E9AE|nr:acyl-CoA dehydrogenase family protein [Amycolatopsis benzoatilytica]
MHFALSDEQRELAAAVRGLVKRRAAVLGLRGAIDSPAGYDTELWTALCEQIGVAALSIPEEYGGAGFSLFETQVVLEALGESLTPTPLLGSGVLAAQALLAADAPELLPGIAAGEVVALAWADRSGRHRTDGSEVVASQADGWVLDGAATLILDGAQAAHLLVIAMLDGSPALFQTETIAETTPALDPTLRFARAEFRATPARLLAADFGPALPRLHAIAAIACTALQVGGAQSCLDRTVAHLKEREQFGRPLGSFQALKHRVADLLVQVETARSISWAAGFAASNGDDPARQAAYAKSWCGDAFTAVAAETVQLHGGIAITWEHDVQLYFKRAHALAQLFGDAREHRARLATESREE